jgi:class 3 adenylate cyclase
MWVHGDDAAVEDRVTALRTEPLALKGFARPINAWSILDIAD